MVFFKINKYICLKQLIMKNKILQFFANRVIDILNHAPNEQLFDYYMDLAIKYDSYLTVFKGIYLD